MVIAKEEFIGLFCHKQQQIVELFFNIFSFFTKKKHVLALEWAKSLNSMDLSDV